MNQKTAFPVKWTDGALARWAARNPCEVCDQVGTMVLEWRWIGTREIPFFACTACRGEDPPMPVPTSIHGRRLVG